MKKGDFGALGLEEFVLKALTRLGYRSATPVQRKAIPAVLTDRDVLMMARTGSGKTAAFLCPIIQRLASHATIFGCRAIVVSPTRELSLQSARFCRDLGKFSDLRYCTLIGGHAMETEFSKLTRNPDIVFGTPARIAHHLKEKGLSLAVCRHVVFDEADRTFEMGFADDVQTILSSVAGERQCILASATLPSQLVDFTRAGLRDPIFVRLDSEFRVGENVDLNFVAVRPEQKLAAFLHLSKIVLQGSENALYFVCTKHHAEFYGRLLTVAGYSASVIFGTMDQEAREAALKKFVKRKSQVLVVTDVAARGIDIPDLSTVVNVDFPMSPKHFVHRIGRTARAGKHGRAFSLLTMTDLPYFMELLLFLGLPAPSLSPTIEATGGYRFGGFQDLEEELEAAPAFLKNDSELIGLQDSMTAATKMYHRTRPSASKHSARRARTWLKSAFQNDAALFYRQDIGLKAPLVKDVDTVQRVAKSAAKTSLREIFGKPADAADSVPPATAGERKSRDAWISKIRGFRADSTKFRALPVEVSHRMENQAFLSDLSNFKTIAPAEESGYDTEDFDEPEDEETGASCVVRSRLLASGADDRVDHTNFLSTEKSATASSRMDNLRIEQPSDYQMDLLGDDTRGLKKSTFVRRWNARKKRYQTVAIDDRGHVKKSQNESGARIKSTDSTGLYRRWQQQTKRKIPSVGESEPVGLPMPDAKKSRKYVEAGPPPEEKPDLRRFTKDMDLIDKFESNAKLTNKQKRKMKRIKNSAEGAVAHGTSSNARDELRTPVAIRKRRELKISNSGTARQKSTLRQKKKDLHMKKRHIQSIKKGAPQRSMAIVRRRG